MSARVIINADDLGLRRSVNAGVRDLLERGVLSSATIMVNYDPAALEEAAGIAREFGSSAGFGLHLDLDRFFPFDQAGRYGLNEHDVPDGFHETMRARAGEIDSEIRRQFERISAAGVAASHVDGHHNAHLFPQVFEMLAPVMIEHGVRAVRDCDGFFIEPDSRRRVLKILRDRGIAVADRFYDLSQLMHPGGLRGLPEGVAEIMVHAEEPGSPERWRAAQRRFLLDHEEEIQSLSLINYSDVVV
jgi:predicted glycoside hydrolase/deacetylase ChbG (UPF0249 family)